MGGVEPAKRALVIGVGNPSRQDDSVGLVVAEAVSKRLGIDLCGESCTLDDLQGPVGAMWVQQLAPELAELIAAFDLLIVVDAHTEAEAEELSVVELAPAYRSGLVSHHMAPETLVAMARDLYGHAPRAVLVSVRGYQFDFGTDLSPRTSELAHLALESILDLLRDTH